MIHQKLRVTAAVFLAGDIVATLLAFLAAWYLRFVNPVVELTKGVPAFGPYLQLLPFILIVWPTVFYFHGLYRARRSQTRMDELFTLVVALLLAVVILTSLTTFSRPAAEPGSGEPFTYSRVFFFLFLPCNLIAVFLSRFAIRSVLRSIRLRGHNLKRILVIGAGEVGKEIARKLVEHREMGLEVVGFVDDDPGKANYQFGGLRVLGKVKNLSSIIEQQRVDQVMIALPLDAHKKILKVLDQIGDECLEVRLVPNVLQYATMRAEIEDFDGTPVINLSHVPLEGWSGMIKRGIDIALSSAAMLVLLPFFPLVAALIWLEDRGPVFYRQERMGLDGKSFMILKLRSMRVNAESTTGPIWAVKDDPRRTRLGSFLRRTSLDELPQLWNVFRGDMSMIGPRPERPAFVSEFRSRFPNYMLRHRVKAGITGWAQVHGWRGNTSIRKRLQYDLYYIENWSLSLDFKILWLTLRGLTKNAY